MHRTLVLGLALVILVAAAGCFGMSQPAPSGSTAESGPAPAARFTIAHWNSATARTRAGVTARCPAVAHCAVRPVRYGHSSRWGLRIVRHLNRLPARGGYLDPRTACRTLLQYIRLMQHRGNAVCSCPIQIVPPGMAAGILRGHRVSVAVDACAACGAGPPAGHDVGVLLVG